jgi:multicomponent Na+:H+ antiporter subunit B
MMKWLSLIAGIAFYLKMIILPTVVTKTDFSIVDVVLQESGIPNVVSGIILRNRLYDTIFEVVVFTIAIMGTRFLLANEQPSCTVYQFTDYPSIVLARLGSTISALISVDLAIRGHLSPGGGFAAGVAGGTAIGLIAITSSTSRMEALYTKYQAAAVEKVSVLIFIGVALLSLIGLELPHGELGTLFSGGWIPVLNILVALKVALGAWAAILVFIRYRGLL